MTDCSNWKENDSFWSSWFLWFVLKKRDLFPCLILGRDKEVSFGAGESSTFSGISPVLTKSNFHWKRFLVLTNPQFPLVNQEGGQTLWRRKDCDGQKKELLPPIGSWASILSWNSISCLTRSLGLLNSFHSHRNRSHARTTFSIVILQEKNSG